MELREKVQSVLEALCEGTGVSVDDDGDFVVDLHASPVWVRVNEECRAVTVFSGISLEPAFSREVAESCNEVTKRWVMFRLFWESEVLVLRADVPTHPFSAKHLQRVLDDFGRVVGEVLAFLESWTEAGGDRDGPSAIP